MSTGCELVDVCVRCGGAMNRWDVGARMLNDADDCFGLVCKGCADLGRGMLLSELLGDDENPAYDTVG